MIRIQKKKDEEKDEKTAVFSEVLVRWSKNTRRRDMSDPIIYNTEEPLAKKENLTN